MTQVTKETKETTESKVTKETRNNRGTREPNNVYQHNFIPLHNMKKKKGVEMFSEMYVMKDSFLKLLFCCYFIDQFIYILQENRTK